MLIDPFHLASTPIPVLPSLGLRSEVGLSGEDPSVKRHLGMGFSVWLTVYSPQGERVKRAQIGRLEHGQRRFFDLSALSAEFGYAQPYLCVVHRIPSDLPASETPVEVPEGRDLDFDMYRSVCQFVRPGGGRGSVIYETPPHFNGSLKKAGSFLSFSNQILLGPQSNTYLALLHYSINPRYAAVANRRILAYAPDGSMAGSTTAAVRPFTVDLTDCSALLGASAGAEGLRQFSFVACSNQASMIPLIINVDSALGGVSVEHTHPPLSYLNMPFELGAALRNQAIEHHLAAA